MRPDDSAAASTGHFLANAQHRLGASAAACSPDSLDLGASLSQSLAPGCARLLYFGSMKYRRRVEGSRQHCSVWLTRSLVEDGEPHSNGAQPVHSPCARKRPCMRN